MAEKLEINLFAPTYPQLVRELAHPAHGVLALQLADREDEAPDLMEVLVYLCTTLNIPLEGDYTISDLCTKVLDELVYIRRKKKFS